MGPFFLPCHKQKGTWRLLISLKGQMAVCDIHSDTGDGWEALHKRRTSTNPWNYKVPSSAVALNVKQCEKKNLSEYYKYSSILQQ